jgi:YfiH family protein
MRVLPNAPTKHALGHVIETTDVTVFFGDWKSSVHALSTAFPEYHLRFVRQTHSDVVITSHSPDEVRVEENADAHLTAKGKLALCIRTADCLPIMIFEPQSRLIAAIHAGWRGIANGIVLRACEHLLSLGGTLNRAHVWIGPHISGDSFEVGRDIALKLEASFDAVRGFSPEGTAIKDHIDSQKSYVDLLAIARAQLKSNGIEKERTTILAINTFSSSEHASYRRDAVLAGRQISFIALK